MSKIAIIGATDSIGREVLNLLEQGGFNKKDVFAVEHKAQLGTTVAFGEDDDVDVSNLDDFDFSKVSIAVFASTPEISKKYASKAASKGAKVVDCTDAYRLDPDVPMIIAGINDKDIKNAKKSIISLPGSYVTQMLLPLKSIDDNYKITRIVTTTYTSVSVYGKAAMDELFNQTRRIFMNDTLANDKTIFNKQIAFNVIPQEGDFIGDETKTEWEINVESKKILGQGIKVHANCAVVPAFIGSAQYVNVECEKDIDVDDAKKLMEKVKGVVVFDKHVDGGYVCLTDVQGEDNVYVSRLRQDVSTDNGISFWVVADNLRAGIAKNAFNIIQSLKK